MYPPAIIRTPSDFVQSVSGHSFVQDHLARVSTAEEQELRGLLSTLFQDLQYLEPSDPTEVKLFAQDLEEPLKELCQLGFELLWFRTKGTLHTGTGEIPNWRTVHYLIVNSRGLFAFRIPDSIVVHSMLTPCVAGWEQLTQALLKGDGQVFTWRSMNSLRLTHGLSFKVCEDCETNRTSGSIPLKELAPAFELLNAAGWGSHRDSALPRIIHALVSKAVMDVLGTEAMSAKFAEVLLAFRKPDQGIPIIDARIVLFLSLESIVEGKSFSARDRAKALGVLILLAKAWGWELGVTDFRVPTQAAPLRTDEHCARALRDLSAPKSVCEALSQLSAESLLLSPNTASFESAARTVFDDELWRKLDEPARDLEDKKWQALRLLAENPNLSIKSISEQVGIDRSHFYRDPLLKKARNLHLKDPNRIPRARFDERTGQIDGEVFDDEPRDNGGSASDESSNSGIS